jgi:hypothetical protein
MEEELRFLQKSEATSLKAELARFYRYFQQGGTKDLFYFGDSNMQERWNWLDNNSTLIRRKCNYPDEEIFIPVTWTTEVKIFPSDEELRKVVFLKKNREEIKKQFEETAKKRQLERNESPRKYFLTPTSTPTTKPTPPTKPTPTTTTTTTIGDDEKKFLYEKIEKLEQRVSSLEKMLWVKFIMEHPTQVEIFEENLETFSQMNTQEFLDYWKRNIPQEEEGVIFPENFEEPLKWDTVPEKVIPEENQEIQEISEIQEIPEEIPEEISEKNQDEENLKKAEKKAKKKKRKQERKERRSQKKFKKL